MLKSKTKLDTISNYELLQHFKDAVMDRNYNPTSEDYNKSGHSLGDLEEEVIKRMNKCSEHDATDFNYC
jgi:hypothetical protein